MDGRPGGFVRNVNWVLFTTVGAYLVGLLANIVVTRALSPEARGLYAIFLISVTLAAGLLTIGYHHAGIYFIGRGKADVPTVLGQGLFVVLFAGAGAGLLALGAAAVVGDRLPVLSWPGGLFIISVAALVAVQVLNGVFIAEGRFGAMNLLTVLRPGQHSLFFLAAAWFGLLSFPTAVALWTASLLLNVGTGILLVGRKARGIVRPGWPRWDLLRPMIGFGLTGQSGNLAQLLNYRLDSYLVLALVGRADVAYYAIATAAAEALWFLPTAVSTVLLPGLTRAQADEAGRFTAFTARLTLAISLGGALAIAMLAPVMLPLVFGESYTRSVPALYALLPGAVAASLTKVLASYIFGSGRVGINTGVAFLALSVTLALDLLLIPPLGIVGAALASSASYLTSMLLTLWFFRRLSGSPVVDALLPKASDLAEINEQLKRFRHAGPALRKLP